MATKEIFDAVNEGLNNVMPGRKIASMLAKSYAEKAQKNINDAREESPKIFDSVMAGETARSQNNDAVVKMHRRNQIRNAVGMQREPEEFGPDINIEENTFGKTSGGTPPSKPKLFGNKQTEWKKGGKVSASSRADGIAQRGKTRGKIV
jgi:hypothetical protein